MNNASLEVEALYLDNMAEFGEQCWQGAGIVVLQAQTITKCLAVLGEQLANRNAGVFLSPKQLDQLSRQSLDTLHLRQSQHFFLTTFQHLTKGWAQILNECSGRDKGRDINACG